MSRLSAFAVISIIVITQPLLTDSHAALAEAIEDGSYYQHVETSPETMEGKVKDWEFTAVKGYGYTVRNLEIKTIRSNVGDGEVNGSFKIKPSGFAPDYTFFLNHGSEEDNIDRYLMVSDSSSPVLGKVKILIDNHVQFETDYWYRESIFSSDSKEFQLQCSRATSEDLLSALKKGARATLFIYSNVDKEYLLYEGGFSLLGVSRAIKDAVEASSQFYK